MGLQSVVSLLQVISSSTDYKQNGQVPRRQTKRSQTVHNGGRYHARHRPLRGHLLLQPLQWSTVKGPPKWRAMAGPSTDGGAHGRTPTARGAQAEGEAGASGP